MDSTLKAILEDWATLKDRVRALENENEKAWYALRERLIQIEQLRERLGPDAQKLPTHAEREATLANWEAHEMAAKIRAEQGAE